MQTIEPQELLTPLWLIRIAVAIAGIALVAVVGTWLARRAQDLFDEWVDALLARFVGNLIRWGSIALAVAWAVQWLQLAPLLNGLLAGAGVTAIVLGFAFRDIGENFLSGVILASSRPFSSGDTIQSGEFMGKVVSLDLRNTHLKTFDGKDVYLPNATVFKNPLINFTQDGLLRLDFTIGIDYTDDVEGAIALIRETLSEIEGVLQDPDPVVGLNDFSASTVDLKTFFWVNTLDYRKGSFELRSDAMLRTKTALQEAGFGLPSDIVELKLYDRAGPVDIRLHQVDGGRSSSG